jgi:hypothetical protein
MSAEVQKRIRNIGVDLTGSEELLLISAENLKTGIMFIVSQLKSRKVTSEMKLRWMRSLPRQVEALVKVVQALDDMGNKSAADVDLSTFLSSLEKDVAVRPEAGPRMMRATRSFHTTLKHAQVRVCDLSFASRRRLTGQR